jgi:hypothetical protein
MIECGPENCPLTAWTALSPSERKVQRQPLARKLYEQGFTMEQIATQFGVTHKTISKDLENCTQGTNQKRVKTATNPKGAGRPKGSTKPRGGPKPERRKTAPGVEQTAASLVLDQGKTYEQVRDELGLKSVQTVKTAVAREEGRREPEVNRDELSMTAQQKFDAAIRQHKAKLDASYHKAVDERVRQRIDEIVLPHWKQKIDQAQELYQRRRGLMTKETFNTIRRALHPDSRHSISDNKLAEAFDAFMALEKYLLNEKESPTEIGDLPRSWQEWEAAKQKTTKERRARYRAGRSALRPR